MLLNYLRLKPTGMELIFWMVTWNLEDSYTGIQNDHIVEMKAIIKILLLWKLSTRPLYQFIGSLTSLLIH